jgi:hypothetical protein
LLNKQAPSKVLTVLNIEAVQIGGIGHELLGRSTSKAGLIAVLKTKKMVIFSEASSGEASLNRACSKCSHHWCGLRPVLKSKTFYD